MQDDAAKNQQAHPVIIQKRAEAPISCALNDQVLLVDEKPSRRDQPQQVEVPQVEGLADVIHDEQENNLQRADRCLVHIGK